MAKASAARNTRTANKAVEQFNVAAWRADLIAAFQELASASTKALHVVLAGRGKVEEATAREAITEAFIAAGYDEKGQTIKNRVSEAMAVFKAKALPSVMPANLQHAAKAVREHNKATGEAKARKPRQGATDTKPQAGDPAPLVALSKAIEQVRKMDGLSEAALELIGELADLAGDLADAILKPVK